MTGSWALGLRAATLSPWVFGPFPRDEIGVKVRIGGRRWLEEEQEQAMGEPLTRRQVFTAAATLVLADTAGVEGRDNPMDQPVDLSKAHLRVARPSDDLAALVKFYRDGLGFDVLYEFNDHDGFDGVML